MKCKGIAVLLVLIVTASLSNQAVMAAFGDIATPAFSDIAGHEAEVELTLLAALGVFGGDSGLGGPVRPNATITRAEFAKVLIEAVGRGSVAQSLDGLPPRFSDADLIPGWAWGYVNVADYLDVIDGYEDGSFGATDPVTYAEAVTMLVRAVGGHRAQVPTGNWPFNYIFYAVDHGFTGPVEVGYHNLPATRGDIARLLFATMQVPRLTADGVVIPDSAILHGRVEQTAGVGTTDPSDDVYEHRGHLYRGEVIGFDPGTSAGGVSPSPTLTIAEGAGAFAVPLGDPVYLMGADQWPNLIGLNVLGVVEPAAAGALGRLCLVAVDETARTQVEVFARYVDTDLNGTADAYEFESGAVVPYTEATLVVLNGLAPAAEDGSRLGAGDECRVTIGGDAKASAVQALRFDLTPGWVGDIIPSTSESDTEIWVYHGGTYTHYLVEASAQIAVNDLLFGRDDLERWDVVELATQQGTGSYNATSNPLYAIRCTRNAVEGVVRSFRTSYSSEGTAYHTILRTNDGTETEYRTASTGGIYLPLVQGETGRFGLDRSGQLYVRIDYEMPAYRALVKSYVTSTAGSAREDLVTLDLRGAEAAYQADPGGCLHELVGTLGTPSLTSNTNQVTEFTPWYDDAVLYDVVAVDPADASVTLRGSDGRVLFIEDPIVYECREGNYTYIPISEAELWESDLTGVVQAPVVLVESQSDFDTPVLIVHHVAPVRAVVPDGAAVTVNLTPQVHDAWFRFGVQDGQVYTVETAGWEPGGAPYLALFNQGQTQPFCGPWGHQATFTAANDGYVYVRAWTDTTYGTYSLTVTTAGETVTELSVGTSVGGTLSSEDPVQWYRFAVTAGTQYVIETLGLTPATCDTMIEILEPASRAPLVNDEASIDPEAEVPGSLFYGHASQLRWTADYTGEVVVRVQAGSSSPNPYGSYQLLVTSPPKLPASACQFPSIDVGPTGIWGEGIHELRLCGFPVVDGTTYYIVLEGYGVGASEGALSSGWTANPALLRLYRLIAANSYGEVLGSVYWNAPGEGWFLVYHYDASTRPSADGRLYITVNGDYGSWRLRVLTTDPRLLLPSG